MKTNKVLRWVVFSIIIFLSLLKPNVYGETENLIEESRSRSQVGRGSVYRRNIDLQSINYPIYIHWEFRKTDHKGDHREDPTFWIHIHNNGSVTQNRVARGRGSYTGMLYVPANSWLEAVVNVGETRSWHHMSWDYYGYGYYYKIAYIRDEQPPKAPGLPQITNIMDGTNENGVFYTNAPLALTWEKVTDNPSMYYDKPILSGMKDYLIGGSTASNDSDPATWAAVNHNDSLSKMTHTISLPYSGLFYIRLKARDNEGNISPAGPELKVMYDTTAPTVPGVPFIPGGIAATEEITWNWNPSIDEASGSGLKGYEVYIATSDGSKIIADWEFTPTHSFTHGVEDGQTYLCKVRAVDKALNKSNADNRPVGSVIIDRSVPAVKFDRYPIRQDGTKVTVCWPEVTGDYSGIKEYQVALTTSPEQPGSGAEVYQVANNQFQKELTIASSSETYYAWVRAVDNLGNQGEWVSTPPFPAYRMIGPENGLFSKGQSHQFNVEERYPINGDELRFKVVYQRMGGSKQDSGTMQSGPVSVNFLEEGRYQWWLEIAEYTGGREESGSKQITEKFDLAIDNTKPSGSFNITSLDGTQDYSESVPTKNLSVRLTKVNLADDSGQIKSGVKGIYLWNGPAAPRPDDASYRSATAIPAAGIPWQLPDQDGVCQVNMLVLDRAGNSCLISNTVTLDRVAPDAPINLGHIQVEDSIKFSWQSNLPSDDLKFFRGAYEIAGQTPVPFETFPDAAKGGVWSVNVSGIGANQPVILKLWAVDLAGNESPEVSYAAYTPAKLGEIQFLGGGYNPVNSRHFLKWQFTPGIESETYLEYGEANDAGFAKQGQIVPSGNQVIHDALANGDKLQPHGRYSFRLVAVNQSGDPTYGPVFSETIPNQEPTPPEPIAPLEFARDSVECQFTPATDDDGDILSYTIYVGEGANPVSFTKLTGSTCEGLIHGQTYSWYVVVDDGHQGIKSSTIAQFIVDTEKPELTVTEARRPYTNQNRLTVAAKDALSGIDRVTYKKYVGGEAVEEGSITLFPDQEGNQIGTIPLGEGRYHLHFTAWDKAGNTFAVERNNLMVDHTAPELSGVNLDLPQKGGKYLSNTNKIAVSWHGTDDFSGIRNLRYGVVESTAGSLETGTFLPLSAGLSDYQYTLDFDGENGKVGYLALALEDQAGNLSTIQKFGPILLDMTKPEGELILNGLVIQGANRYLADGDQLDAEVSAFDPESEISDVIFNMIDSTRAELMTAWSSWSRVKRTVLIPGARYQVAAKVKNGVGLETDLQSAEFIYDPTPPQDVTITGPAAPLVPGEVAVFRINAAENESTITTYRLAIGSSSGGNELTAKVPGNQGGWLILQSNAAPVDFRVEVPEIADGTYYPAVQVVNGPGLTTFKNGDGITVAHIQNRTVVNDQGPFTMFDDELAGWWHYAGDQAISGYRYRIITRQGKVVRDWQATAETIAVVKGLKLESGQMYRFEVQADLRQGGSTDSDFSPGVTVDATPGVIDRLSAPNYATSNNLRFSWNGNDPESGVDRVEVALGSDYYRTDVSGGWLTVNGNDILLTHAKNGEPLNLISGSKYYLTLRLTNGAGLISETIAPGILIDDTPPPVPVVYDQGAYINLQQPLEAHWIWSPVDPESGVAYEWAVVEDPQAITGMTWNPGAENFRAVYDGPREHGHTYYFVVKATNGAGLSSIGRSNGIMIDATAPSIPHVVVLSAVNIGHPDGAAEVNYMTDGTDLGLWIDALDLESGINGYQYAYGNIEEVDAANATASPTPAVTLEGVTLENGEIIFFRGECFNGADQISQSGYSTGIMLDSGAPQVKNVRGGVSGDRLLFDWDVEASASPVAGYEVALVTADRVASSPDAWQKVGLNRSVMIEGEGLADGKYILLVRGYNRAGTYSRRQGNMDEWGESPILILDRTAPVLKELNHGDFASKKLEVQAAAEDNLSGIHSYQYALGSRTNPVAYSQGWVDIENAAGWIGFDVPTGHLVTNTETFLMVRVKDKVGLWSKVTVSGPVLIDQSPPATPVVRAPHYANSLKEVLNIEYTSEDPESGVTHYRMGLVTEKEEEWLVTQLKPLDQFDGKLTDLNLTEAGVYRIALQTKNAAGDWSLVGYSEPFTVDSIKPELVFNRAMETLVINRPPLGVDYTLSEAGQVKFIITGYDGSSEELIEDGVPGLNHFTFTKAKPQLYSITAIATDLAGNVSLDVAQNIQRIRVNAPPVVSLATEIVTAPGKPLPLTAVVTDPDGESDDTFIYQWLPGDGSPALLGDRPIHRYTGLGEYTVSLTVTDKDGGVSAATTLVKVGNTTRGQLYMDEVWSGIHRIYDDVVVPQGIKLTVRPNTQVIVDGIPGDTGYFHGLIVHGSLVVEGDGAAFTSITGEKGGWRGIEVSGRAQLDGVAIRHAERGVAAFDSSVVNIDNTLLEDNKVGVHVYNAKPTIRNTVFQNNLWYGIKEDEAGRPVVTGCRFSENTIDYYHETLTEISIEQLNQLKGNHDNQ